MTIPSIRDLELKGKRLLIREDLNVPLQGGQVAHGARIEAALPTLRFALEQGARVIVLSHLGRPVEGQQEEALSLAPVAAMLSQLLGQPVPLIKDYFSGFEVMPGEIVMLENIRFMSGESESSIELSKKLAALCEIFVMDAFAVSHRAQASTVGVARYAPQVATGFLMESEISALTRAFEAPKRPLVAIIGGSKVSTKFKVLDHLLDKADCIVIGGGMANTFLKAQGYPVGRSLVEDQWLNEAKSLIEKAKKHNKSLILPLDVRCATELREDAPCRISTLEGVLAEDIILDIGPKTVQAIEEMVAQAGTVVWNGPLGVFEFKTFKEGTFAVARAVAHSKAFSLAGGGDTLAALEQSGMTNGIDYLSTAGGAFLEFLEGAELPGLEVLKQRCQAT